MHYITPYFFCCFFSLTLVLCTPVCRFCQSLWLASKKKKKKRNPLAVLPQEQVCVGWQKRVAFFPRPFHFFFVFGRGLSDLQCEDNNDPSVPKQSILWDTLIARCGVIIKHRRRHKQESASGCWQDCTETQVPLTQYTRAHFSTESVGQEQACALRAKTGVIIIRFSLPPCSSEHRCGSLWQRPI